MGRITDAIERIYREEHISLPRTDLGALAARKYREIVTSADPAALGDEIRQIAIVHAMADRLRQELLAAVAAPDGSKHQASA